MEVKKGNEVEVNKEPRKVKNKKAEEPIWISD